MLTTLSDLTLQEVVALYEDRRQIEVEIQSDKVGLVMARRRTRSLAAQELLILLSDWVHKFLAMLHATIFQDSPLASFGPKRLIGDALAIRRTATFQNGELASVQLRADHR